MARLPSPRVALLALPLLAALGPAPARAATPGKIDERLFTLYILDDFYQKRVPDPRTDTGLVRVNRAPRFGPVAAAVRPEAELADFLAHRQLLFDRLRRYFDRRKLEPAIRGLYQTYERELTLWKEFKDKLTASLNAYCRTVGLAQAAASQRVMGTGLGYGLAAYLGGGSGGDALLAGWYGAARAAQAEQKNLNVVQQNALARLNAELKKAVDEFGPKIEALQGKRSFAKAAGELCAAHGWKDTEFAIERSLSTQARSGDSPNPFLVVEAARAFLAKKDATVDELVGQAQACIRAANRVPAATVYNHFRAGFLSVAGELANRAAAKDLGTTGFGDAIKNPPRAGKLALSVWQSYVRNESIDTNITDQVIHRYIEACGLAGKPTAGYVVIVANCTQRVYGRAQLRPNASGDPTFWYDCARVCSLKGNVVMAGQCLQQAVRLGFRDNEAAKVDPDLQNLRVHRLTADFFKRLIP